MFHSRTIDDKINYLLERCLGVIYNDKILSFKELLERDRSVQIHNRNLQILPTEMFKINTSTAPLILIESFSKWNLNYELRHTSHFLVFHVRKVYNGTESLSFLVPKIWDILPMTLKSGNAFKSGIKKWWLQNCPCRLRNFVFI